LSTPHEIILYCELSPPISCNPSPLLAAAEY
jgi:hypothetical protein